MELCDICGRYNGHNEEIHKKHTQDRLDSLEKQLRSLRSIVAHLLGEDYEKITRRVNELIGSPVLPE